MFGLEKTLIVVYKDEMLMNQLKKLVETHDTVNSDRVSGTVREPFNIVAWTEKVWLGNKKAGNIKDKVLFLGDIKGTDKLIPVIDVVFDNYGVKYGWAGNQAILYSESKALNDREAYISFLNTIAELPIPEMIKKPQNIKIEAVHDKNEETDIQTEALIPADNKKGPVLFAKAKNAIAAGLEHAEKFGNKVTDKAGDILRDKNAVRRQQLFYGVINLCTDGLDKFMNM